MASYWAKLNCKATKGSGNVYGIGTRSQLVQPGKQATFTPNFVISTGGTLDCEVCFESIGTVPFPKPGGGVEYKTEKKCNSVGQYDAKRPCECNDFKDSSGVPYQLQCAANETGVNTQNLYGSAGNCTACRTCNYPDPNSESSWAPARSTRCDGKTFTQTTKSFAAYPTSTSKYYIGCPTQTRQATGTTTPDYNADDICAGVTVSMSPTNCIGDEKQITGTKQPDWSGWVEYGSGLTYDFSQLCESVRKTMTRYDRNTCKNDEYKVFYGQIPNSAQACCDCDPGWSRTMPLPTDCPNGVEQMSPSISSYQNACETCFRCKADCECPAGWSSSAPATSVSTGLQCPAGQTLQTASGSGDDPCDTCYKCVECVEDAPALPGIWAFDTSIPGPCASKCSDLMSQWSGGISGWGNAACGSGTGESFIVSNKSCTKALQITVTSRPNMTVTLQGFQIDGETVSGASATGGSFTFTIPPNCRTPTDISGFFRASYSCTCSDPNSQSSCRGGWVALAPTYSYVDA